MDKYETAQPQADLTANQPDKKAAISGLQEAQERRDDAFLTVRYNSEELPLSKEAVVTYAQKGLNYDKLSDRLAKMGEKLKTYEELDALAHEFAQRSGLTDTEALSVMKQRLGMEREEEAVNARLDEFLSAHPDVDPKGLPEAILAAWKDGTPLVTAYADMLKTQEQAQQTNALNAFASMGGAAGAGGAAPRPISHDAIKNMSGADLERNHSRIWAYLTGQKD